MKLLGILCLELVKMVLLGGLLMLQVAVAVLSEIGELLELLAICWKYTGAKRSQQASLQRGKEGIKKRSRKKKRASRNKNEEESQERMPEEGYRREGRMTAFPDPAAVPGLTPGSSVRGVTPQPEDTGLGRHVYDRRPLMPMPLPGFAGVPFFRGRDTTEFLE